MLSRVELEYIRKPAAFSSDYGRVLRFRIRRKLNKLRDILELLAESEFASYIRDTLSNLCECRCVTENCNALRNSVTLKPDAEKPFSSCFSEKLWCGGRDLNPRRPTPEDLKSSPLS